MIIDLYTHIFPKPYFDDLVENTSGLGGLKKRISGVKPLIDLDARLSDMDAIGADYRQVLSLPHPALEEVATPEEGTRLARLGNDGLADICRRYPDRFPAFVATVCMSDMAGAVAEAHRAVGELGARGIQIFTNVAGRPLDEPEFEPIFAAASELNVPIWMHPARTADTVPDYTSEKKSRYEMWWCFGWPYETSVAMSRLVFSGMFDRYPNLDIVTHHLGGMVPFFDGRVGKGMEYLGSRTPDEDYSQILSSLKRPHLEYFKMFHADTAMMGGDCGLPTGLKFFGPERVVFATDAPLSDIRPALDVILNHDMAEEDRQKILSGNAKRLLRLS